MAELKTQRNDKSVAAFLNRVEAKYREDCRSVLELMKEVTGQEPAMWGTSMVGFGSYHYKGRSGREGDWFLTGFSPRKQDLTLYIMPGFERYGALLSKLGKHKTGKSCPYIKSLDDIHMPTLRKLVKQSVAHVAKGNGCGVRPQPAVMGGNLP